MIAALLLLIAHGPSKSFADWTIEERTADVRVNFQSHDLTRSQHIGDEDSLIAAVLAGTKLSAADRTGAPEVACAGRANGVTKVGDPVEEVQVRLHFECPSSIALFTASEQYLPGLSPPHVTIASFTTEQGGYDHVFGPETLTLSRRAAPDATDSKTPQIAGAMALAAAMVALLAWKARSRVR